MKCQPDKVCKMLRRWIRVCKVGFVLSIITIFVQPWWFGTAIAFGFVVTMFTYAAKLHRWRLIEGVADFDTEKLERKYGPQRQAGMKQAYENDLKELGFVK